MLKAAVEWDVLLKTPVRIKQLEVATPEMDFQDFDEYERIVEASQRLDPRYHERAEYDGVPPEARQDFESR